MRLDELPWEKLTPIPSLDFDYENFRIAFLQGDLDSKGTAEDPRVFIEHYLNKPNEYRIALAPKRWGLPTNNERLDAIHAQCLLHFILSNLGGNTP
jgi:hypothetical protein